MKSIRLIFICAMFMSSSLLSQTIIFEDNFDSYITDKGVASQSASWQTWTQATGNNEDALVSAEQAFSGGKSLHIINDNDMIYNLGSKISGVYAVAFQIYIKSGNGAYLNMEHGNRSKFAFQMFFRENNEIWFDNGTDSMKLSTFTTNQWFSLKFLIDLNTDYLAVYKDNVKVEDFTFSLSMNTAPSGILGVIDFYGANNSPKENLNNSNYFIDDFQFIEVSPPNPTSGCNLLNYFATGAQFTYEYYNDLGEAGTVISTSGNFDDANSNPIDIGFTFRYNCMNFTKFILNTNGFIKLGDTPPSSEALFYAAGNTTVGGIFNSSNPADVNLISPFNHDLFQGKGTPEYRVLTAGGAPDRICIIQFKNLSEKTAFPVQQFENIEFQIQLYETTNVIEFIYGNWTPSSNLSALKTSGCGLKGSSFSDKDLLLVSKGSVTAWNSATFINSNYISNAFNFGNPPERPVPESGMAFRFVPALENDLKLAEIYTLETSSIVFSNPLLISANIINNGMNEMSDVNVQLTITGANSFTDIVTIPQIDSKAGYTVTFDPFSPANAGSNEVFVSLPNDDELGNNQKYLEQFTTEYLVKYSLGNNPEYHWGFGATKGGILLTKYNLSEPGYVKSVTVYLTSSAAVGYPVYAVIMDESGTIIGQSNQYIVKNEDMELWHDFSINNSPLISTGSIYAGFAIPPADIANYALGAQSESPLRSDAYYYSAIGGGSLKPGSARFMIGANLSKSTGIGNDYISGDEIQMFPNPAQDKLTISGLTKSTIVGIYTINGKPVKTTLLDQKFNVININDLSRGIYIVKMKTGNAMVVRKLVKQ